MTYYHIGRNQHFLIELLLQCMLLHHSIHEQIFFSFLFLFQFHKLCYIMTSLTNFPRSNWLKIGELTLFFGPFDIKYMTSNLYERILSKIFTMQRPAGQLPQFAVADSILSPVQDAPPCSSCVNIPRTLTFLPEPQVMGHDDQGDHVFHSQLTV